MRSDLRMDLQGWLREGLYVSDSALQGKGLFTSRPIAAGELVIRWGGCLLSVQTRDNGLVKDHTAVAVSEDLVIAAHPDQDCTPDDYMNHSCNPSLWMGDAISLIARRHIKAGEELTADYALWMDNQDYVMRRACRCGASDCRGQITGKDWKLSLLQERYAGHFSPFLQRRIHRMSSTQRSALPETPINV